MRIGITTIGMSTNRTILQSATLIAGAVFLSFSAPSLFSQPTPNVTNHVLVIETEGRVESTPPGQPERWNPCGTNHVLYPGYQIRTDARGRAMLRLPDGSPVSLGPDSHLEVFPQPEERTWFQLFKGAFYLFRRGPARQYRVKTPSVSTITVTPPLRLTIDAEGSLLSPELSIFATSSEQPFALQSSTNFMDWITRWVGDTRTADLLLTETNLTDHPRRTYRAVPPQ